MALVSRARARFKFFGTLALAQFLARSRAPEKSSALAFNSGSEPSKKKLICTYFVNVNVLIFKKSTQFEFTHFY